jgi:glyoxylase I family protein
VEVIGVTDHHIFKSIYFFDPNGIRLELSAQLASEDEMFEQSRSVHARLAAWTERKARWRTERAAAEAAPRL